MCFLLVALRVPTSVVMEERKLYLQLDPLRKYLDCGWSSAIALVDLKRFTNPLDVISSRSIQPRIYIQWSDSRRNIRHQLLWNLWHWYHWSARIWYCLGDCVSSTHSIWWKRVSLVTPILPPMEVRNWELWLLLMYHNEWSRSHFTFFVVLFWTKKSCKGKVTIIYLFLCKRIISLKQFRIFSKNGHQKLVFDLYQILWFCFEVILVAGCSNATSILLVVLVMKQYSIVYSIVYRPRWYRCFSSSYHRSTSDKSIGLFLAPHPCGWWFRFLVPHHDLKKSAAHSQEKIHDHVILTIIYY